MTPANSGAREFLANLAHELRTQDNAFTSDPIFMVQQRVVTYGMDPDYSDDVVWIHADDYSECEPKLARRLERLHDECYDCKTLKRIAERYTRTAKQEHWENIQPFFTRAAAEEWITRNKHNYPKGLRVYVESANRNPEWKAIRAFILDAGTEGGGVMVMEATQ